jgi:hypothetical protein
MCSPLIDFVCFASDWPESYKLSLLDWLKGIVQRKLVAEKLLASHKIEARQIFAIFSAIIA